MDIFHVQNVLNSIKFVGSFDNVCYHKFTNLHKIAT